ncbi:MAG: hypothetical protein M1838_002395 [Thelocarpon superellum]|nr:MAG: hypothetical protein M1838_002395 [Thelocarpon superellum]
MPVFFESASELPPATLRRWREAQTLDERYCALAAIITIDRWNLEYAEHMASVGPDDVGNEELRICAEISEYLRRIRLTQVADVNVLDVEDFLREAGKIR